jgi:glycerol-3-phosphate acyltransferase PlsY
MGPLPPAAEPLTLLLISYLLGSIPFSFLVVKAIGGEDIRQKGSGNVGATNVMRTAGKIPGVVALLLDVAKGWAAGGLAIVLTRRPEWPFPPEAGPLLGSHSFWIAAASLLVVLGHIFPVWLRFRGGKGVATAAGVFLAVDPVALAASALLFLIVVLATRYVSLGSIVAAATVAIFMRFMTHPPMWTVVSAVLIGVLVIARHHENIARLAQRREHRLGEKKKDPK